MSCLSALSAAPLYPLFLSLKPQTIERGTHESICALSAYSVVAVVFYIYFFGAAPSRRASGVCWHLDLPRACWPWSWAALTAELWQASAESPQSVNIIPQLEKNLSTVPHPLSLPVLST